MAKNILIFRTDRIGDLIFSCPTIITIKDYFKDSVITIITSNKNYAYAKNLNLFDFIYKFPKNNILNKINLILELRKKSFDYIFILDGKERSIISSILIKSNTKISLIRKNKFYYRFMNIKFFLDDGNDSINLLFQKALTYCKINKTISNYNFLQNKTDNKFSYNIKIKNYIHIHLDEKWFNELYIKKYTDIKLTYDNFIIFLNNLSKEKNILITSGIKDFLLLETLKNKFLNKQSEKIFFKKSNNNLIYYIHKPTFDDLESLLKNSFFLISCHGAITHAANSFNVKIIDIIEKNKNSFYERFTSYLKNYYPIYRSDFETLQKNILNIINDN